MTEAPRNRVRTTLRWLLGLMLLGTGSSHLTWARDDFQAQVPDWVPLDKDLVVLLSGVVELIFGAALILPHRKHATVGGILAAFFVAIFPGNVSQYVHHRSAFGLNTDTRRFVRLFFQPVLVAWAAWSTGAWASWQRGGMSTPLPGRPWPGTS
jgi:uncharacterized membrane protein